MDAPSKVPRPPRLSDTVACGIEQWISAEGLAPGTQLPSEKALCDRFGVSRAVIREAISRLKAEGCVRTHQGLGAFVAAAPGQGSFRLLAEPATSPDEAADVFELRYLVETDSAALAARRRGEEDLARLRAALEEMEAALAEGQDAGAGDDAFHVAIAAATGNPQLARFVDFMGRQFSHSRAPTWNAEGYRSGRAAQAQEEHRRLFAAIAAGDAAAARAAAEAHLAGAARRLGIDPARWYGGRREEGKEGGGNDVD